MNKHVLLTYYEKYLRDIRGLSESSVGHYTQALRRISKMLVDREKVEETIYEIQDIGELEVIKAYLFNDPEFIELNAKGHQMYSSGLNNYLRFAYGEDFANAENNKIQLLDIELPVPDKKVREISAHTRSSIIKLQSIESAGYRCEFDDSHVTFTAKSTGHPYMEGHHVVPMKYQDKFEHSLDVYANVVCLCPICHRLLHYGVESEKENVVNKIYHDRVDRLASSGIKISRNDFMKIVV